MRPIRLSANQLHRFYRGGELLNRLNELRVIPGDRILVPAGLPHAIGDGILRCLPPTAEA